ncbi:hypothetical protein BGW39_004646, partial [Mortierella sp. 14UC]
MDITPSVLNHPIIGPTSAAGPSSKDADTPDEVEDDARLNALLAESSGDTSMTTAQTSPKDSLVILEGALLDARHVVQSLCEQAAAQHIKRQSVLALPEPKRSEALTLLAKMESRLKVQTTAANQAVEDVELKVKTLKATMKALRPVPLLTEVPYDASLPYHAAIKRIFDFRDIPTDHATGEINWARIGGLPSSNAPTLNLTLALKTATSETLMTAVVQVVQTFLEKFKKHYEDKVVELFPRLAWHYM